MFDIIKITDASSLLLLSGDIEENPGPDTLEYNTYAPPRLRNGGTNTCFVNSCIQLLNSIPACHLVLTNTHSIQSSPLCLDTNLKRILNKITDPLQIKNDHIFDCRSIYKNIMTTMHMRYRSQHDAHEFLIKMFSMTTNAQLKNLFKIQIHEQIVCHSQQCRDAVLNESTNPEYILPLSLDESNNVLNTITQVLTNYLCDSPLPDYRCEPNVGDGCSQLATCTQSQSLFSISDNILIQLKLFYRNDQGVMHKRTNIPIHLDRSFLIDNQTMHLCGVIYHEGLDMHNGHYYTEIYSNGSWYEANDALVYRIPDVTGYDQRKQKVPYILLYRRVEHAPPIAGNPTVSSVKMHNQLLREFELQNEKVAACEREKKIADSNIKSAKSSLKSTAGSKKAKKLGNLTPKKNATSKTSQKNDELKPDSSSSNALNDEVIDFAQLISDPMECDIDLNTMDCKINEMPTKSANLKRKISHDTLIQVK